MKSYEKEDDDNDNNDYDDDDDDDNDRHIPGGERDGAAENLWKRILMTMMVMMIDDDDDDDDDDGVYKHFHDYVGLLSLDKSLMHRWWFTVIVVSLDRSE